MATVIRANKNLFNDGQCFTKGMEYEVVSAECSNTASLIDATVINDQNERHIIGSWWRDFKIVK